MLPLKDENYIIVLKADPLVYFQITPTNLDSINHFIQRIAGIRFRGFLCGVDINHIILSSLHRPPSCFRAFDP